MESAKYYGYITRASTGTTRKSDSAGVIADYRFVLPPQELVTKFERRVSEIRSLLTTSSQAKRQSSPNARLTAAAPAFGTAGNSRHQIAEGINMPTQDKSDLFEFMLDRVKETQKQHLDAEPQAFGRWFAEFFFMNPREIFVSGG